MTLYQLARIFAKRRAIYERRVRVLNRSAYSQKTTDEQIARLDQAEKFQLTVEAVNILWNEISQKHKGE